MGVAIEILQLVATFAVCVVLPAMVLSRVKNAARGEVDKSVGKVLADYDHSLELQLEGHRTMLKADFEKELEKVRQSLALDRERYSRDYELFATRRFQVYADTYGELQKAIGGYAGHLGTMFDRRDYSYSPEVDLRDVAERLELITAAERHELVARLDAGQLRDARELATTLHERESVRRAHVAFRDFKRVWVLNALYFSPDVEALLLQAVHHLAALSLCADEIIEERPVQRVKAAESLQKADVANADLKKLMRTELQHGFSPTEMVSA